MSEESKVVFTIKALTARKEYLFKELTRIFDVVKQPGFKDDIEADIQLSVLDKHEALFNDLIKEILTVNTVAKKGDAINTNDFETFRIQMDAIRKRCLNCKFNNSREKQEKVEIVKGGKLPKINLPTFSGEIGEWNSFIEQYNATVHTKGISKVEKLTYLRSILRKEPLSIAMQYELKESSYDLVYRDLVNRYSNARLLANHYLNQIMNFKTTKIYTKFMEVHRAATSGLRNLGINDLTDYLLFQLSYRNLPLHEQIIFDREFNSAQIPTLSDLFNHVGKLARSEELHADLTVCNAKMGLKSRNQQILLSVSDSKIRTCVYCKEEHALFRCKRFAKLPMSKKLDIIEKYDVCKQCLGIHKKGSCWSKYHCRHCHAKNHHSFLCKKATQESAASVADENKGDREKEKPNYRSCNACLSTQTSTVLLGTIKAQVVDNWGAIHNVKVVCDTGSQVNIITNSLVKSLGLKRTNANVEVKGVAQGTPKILGSVTVKLRSLIDKNVTYEFKAVVVPTICDDLPTNPLDVELPQELKRLPLADPNFRDSQKVDILLGADSFMDILSSNEPTLIKSQPSAINTIFGYVLSGRILQNPTSRAFTLCTTALDKTLRSFWEVENVTRQPLEDSSCEDYFRTTTERDPSGKYIVRLPFQTGCTALGNNLHLGLRSLTRLENRFARTSGLFEAYAAIFQDYLDQGHMSPAERGQQYVLPHHCVYKESSTTAVRVVFNASSLDDTGESLNSRLKSGPKLQNELPRLLISFRFHEVALQADIRQMFRNILLHPDDRKYQHVLWRWSPTEEIQQYCLNTVTFGVTSSPYLAQRVLKQLVEDEGAPYPEACEAVLHHTFMDDFVTGSPTVEAAKKLLHDLNTLLSKGGFELRKWASSHSEVLEQMPDEHKENLFVFPTGEEGVKILGLLWDQTSDALRYHVSDPQSDKVTKRSILSYIARIWDCLGLVSPVVLKAKLFLQRLWLLKVDWDEELPAAVANDWLVLVSEMPLLRQLKIPRKVPIHGGQLKIVGFSDASESAMAANVYLHVSLPEGTCESRLLISKTKLAPLKTWTIPRLELTAALLLTSLVDYVRVSKLKDLPVYLFTDSQIVLAWLKIPPHNLKLFVANRVIQIKETLPDAIWNFVPGNINPADMASRGLKPSEILNNDTWWYGPEFLKGPIESWPIAPSEELSLENCPEIKTKTVVQTLIAPILNPEPVTEYLNKPSSLTTLQRVVGFILRYTFNSRNKERRTGPLSSEELETALLTCARLVQQKHFNNEIVALRNSIEIPKGLHKFSPFLDSKQLLRAGGRIRRARSLPNEAKHPLILPKGLRTTMVAIQQRYWIISLRQLLKKRIRMCLRCYKLSSTPLQPLMGELPKERVNISRPFTNITVDFGGPIITKERVNISRPFTNITVDFGGPIITKERVNISRPFTNITVDFGGPIITKETRLRTAVKHKSYLCVFVCMAVKAVHIEVVSELTTKAFWAAFTRFVSKCGIPQKVYSDCGRNFVGAARYVKDNTEARGIEESDISNLAATQNIIWKFTPPYGPNFNGLAEAAIKSAKRLLLRQIGDEVLTFEELGTLLCRIEAVLNSRPLTAINVDPTDNEYYLSPAHFLIGDKILHPPEEGEESMSLKDRWQRVQSKSLAFWKQWSKEYLNTLLQRQRWTKSTPNLRIGQVVFITGETTPPLRWPLGRVTALHTGEDGVARVASVRWAKGEIRRPVSKLVRLPE